MNKFYLIDKPLELSSFDVIRVLRKKLNTSKMGHTGTLDPLATGGLLIAFGNYTKLIPYFEKDKKTYEFTVSLDGITDSFDLGEEIQYISDEKQEKYKKELSLEKIQKIIYDNFTGKITQIPPKYSALKIGGKKACDLVREGKQVDIKSREVDILNIEILEYSYPQLTLRAEVSAGTYIRSIASDLGDIIGTGGYVTMLRRTKIGDLDISLSQELDQFVESSCLDIKELFKNKIFLELDDESFLLFEDNGRKIIDKLNNGLEVSGIFDLPVGEDIFITKDNNVTNIITYDGEKLKAKRKI